MTIVFAYPGNEHLSQKICDKKGYEHGQVVWRNFPDNESYVRVKSDVKNKNVIVLCSLNNPNEKIIPLIFFSRILKEHSAKNCILISPYLAYMRQDNVFNEGEGVTAKYFADILSNYFDQLITIDPHAHRLHLSDIYKIPTVVIHSVEAIADYLKNEKEECVLIGPDSESQQWVKPISEKIDIPFIVVSKKRISDEDVQLNLPDISQYEGRKAIIIDDIISSGATICQLSELLCEKKINKIEVIVIHPIFSPTVEEKVYKAGVNKIVSCNTVQHETNAMDISLLIAKAL